MPGLNIHRNDVVQVISGDGASSKKQGRVLRVIPEKGKVLVEGVRIIKKTISSKTGQRTQGGIAEQEAPLSISNVAIVCPTCGPVRVGYKVEGKTRTRICKKCGKNLPVKK